MITASLNDYGQSGEAQYDAQRHEWLFTRRLGSDPVERLRLLRNPVSTFRSESRSELSTSPQSARLRIQNIRSLASRYPEITAAARLLPQIGKNEEQIERLQALHDSLKSDLLAFGYLTNRCTSREKSKRVPVAALPCGASGDQVMIVCLNRELFRWQEDKDFMLNSSTIRSGERAIWRDKWGPVKQLRFSPTKWDRHEWLAVRFFRATVLLKLVYRLHKTSKPSTIPLEHSAIEHGSSRIQLEQLLVLPVERTGGSPHSDMAFSSFELNRIAILDQQGSCSIWQLVWHRQRADAWDIRQEKNKGAKSTIFNQNPIRMPPPDGWGKIGWIGNSNTIFIASREALRLFDVQNNAQQPVKPVAFPIKDGENLRDIHEDLPGSNHMFVVTSTQVYCLSVDTRKDQDNEGSELRLRVIICWRHFRSPQDISLRISTCRTSNLIYTVLYSCATRLTTVHTLVPPPVAPSDSLCMLDLYPLELGSRSRDKTLATKPIYEFGKRANPTFMVLKELQCSNEEADQPRKLTSRVLESKARFYQLVLLDDDLEIFESIYVSRLDPLPPPDTAKLLMRSRSASTILPESFIVSEVDEDDDQPQTVTHSAAHSSKESWSYRASNGAFASFGHDSWTLNIEWLQRYLQRAEASPTTEFSQALNLIRSTLIDYHSEPQCAFESLLELQRSDFLDREVIVGDVDTASDQLLRVYEYFMEGNIENVGDNEVRKHIMISKGPVEPFTRSLGLEDALTLSSLYDHIVHLWITSLPLNSPARVRIVTEKLARKITTQLSLACHRTECNVFALGNQHEEVKESQGSRSAELPPQLRVSSDGLSRQRTQDAPTVTDTGNNINLESPYLALPTPEPTPSLQSQSSIHSIPASENMASQRIRARVPHMSPQYDENAFSLEILGHWQTAADPSYYDWEAAGVATIPESDEADTDRFSRSHKPLQSKKAQKKPMEHTKTPSGRLAPSIVPSSQVLPETETQESTRSNRVSQSSQTRSFHGSQKRLVKKPKQAGFR